MTGINVEWAVIELDKFIDMTVMSNASTANVLTTLKKTAAPSDEVARQAQVMEQIIDRVIPGWRSTYSDTRRNRWAGHREAAIRAKEELLRREEVQKNLGDDAPEISASSLHPWVWGGAASLWQSGHYRSAVEDAAKKVNAETQNKVGRRDLSETKLFQESFSDKSAEKGKARLRRMANDGSETYRTVQRGAMALAEGIYAGIRNPFGHGDPEDIDEQVALEYLAALSVLARWVDDSTLETTP